MRRGPGRNKLAAVAQISVLLGFPQVHGDNFVVQVALDSQQQPTLSDGSPPQHLVNMSIGGFPFRCQLPDPAAKGPERAQRMARYLATARAAALAGKCFSGQVDGTDEAFELCLGQHFTLSGAAPLLHDKATDAPIETGGFSQVYASAIARPRAEALCICRLPGTELPAEPPCRQGDTINVRRPDGQIALAVVAGEDAGEPLLVRWANESGNQSAVRRDDASATDGRACSAAPALPALASVVGATRSNESMVSVVLAAAPCCSVRALRSGGAELEFQRLLAPVAGRCMRVLSGWWTYEVCWPWSVRQLHLAMDGETESPAVVLGRFSAPLTRRPAAASDGARAHGRRHELAAALEGDACEHTVHTWELSLHSSRQGLAAVGGSFNPAGCGRSEGTIAHVEANVDGCNKFEGRLDGAIVLVKRGKCWFHTKALNAEAAGAAAVVVYNDQRQMVDVMEGVDELPPPHIPTVLVERDLGARLMKALGSQAVLNKVNVDGMDLQRPIATTVTFHCSPEWNERREICEPGDPVDVKLPSSADAEARWPRSAVRVLRATVVELFKHNSSVLVSWQPQGVGEEEGELPSIVLANRTYNGGLRCDSDGAAYIERLSEPQSCQAEFVVHVAALCAHPRLVPPQPPHTQVISCLAENATRLAQARRRQAEPQALGEVTE